MIELLLPIVPLLFLVGSLLCGRYPGLEAAMRLAARIAAPHAIGSEGEVRRRPPRDGRPAVRGRLLIAFGLAQRPPPLAA